jgi:hypothetical protein
MGDAPDMGMMIFRLLADPPQKFQLLLFKSPLLCVCKQVSAVMYQQAALMHRHLSASPIPISLYNWRNRMITILLKLRCRICRCVKAVWHRMRLFKFASWKRYLY